MKGAFAHLLMERMSFDDQLEVEDVLNAAQEWDHGRLPLVEALKVGMIERNDHPSAPYTRFVAIATTPTSDPRWTSLDKLCTRADELQGAVHTRQGRFYRAEADATIRDNQRLFDAHTIWKGIRS